MEIIDIKKEKENEIQTKPLSKHAIKRQNKKKHENKQHTINYKNIYSNIITLIKPFDKSTEKYNENTLTYYIVENSIDTFVDEKYFISNNVTCDFIMVKYEDKNGSNMIRIIHDVNLILDHISKKKIITFYPTNYIFILFEIKLQNTSYSIKLCDFYFSYYISGNIINESVIKYFLKKYHNVDVNNLDVFNYTVNILDNCASMKMLNSSDNILFNVDKYAVY